MMSRLLCSHAKAVVDTIKLHPMRNMVPVHIQNNAGVKGPQENDQNTVLKCSFHLLSKYSCQLVSILLCAQVMFMAFGLDLSETQWIAILILPVVVFSWIRDLDQLSYFSMLANLAILFSLGVIFYDEIYRLTTSNASYQAQIRTTNLPESTGAISVATFLGSAVFAFEGIGVVSSSEGGDEKVSESK